MFYINFRKVGYKFSIAGSSDSLAGFKLSWTSFDFQDLALRKCRWNDDITLISQFQNITFMNILEQFNRDIIS